MMTYWGDTRPAVPYTITRPHPPMKNAQEILVRDGFDIGAKNQLTQYGD
jgi:hypothetical protein